MTSMLLMMNDRLVPEDEAVVSVYDHGFLYGAGLFETFRTYGGQPFLLERHLRRMLAGCREFGITSLPYTEAELRVQIERLLAANDWSDAYVRLSVSAGRAPLGLPSQRYEQPNVILYGKPLPAAQTFTDRAFKTLRVLHLRRNQPEGVERRKSFHYMNCILGKREACSYEEASDAEGLFLNEQGYLAEGVVSNLFFCHNGKLYTPTIETGILPGITRQFIIELAQSAGIEVEQGFYKLRNLQQADEVFVTNSVQEICPVERLLCQDGCAFKYPTGELTARLASLYEARRDECVGAQPHDGANWQPHAKHQTRDFTARLQSVSDRNASSRVLQCRNLSLPLEERTLIMGILNVTPDSFSDGGQFVDVARAVAHAKQMVAEGADLIDVGGESTRPGAEKVSLEVELARVIPVVEALRSEVAVPISVDTYKAEVARQALLSGAHLINDVSGLRADAQMAHVVAQFACPIIIMHNRKEPEYSDLLEDIKRDLLDCIAIGHAAGISDAQILLDPGVGFAKTHEQNLLLMNQLHALNELGYPLLLGTSRKRFIRNTLACEAVDCVEGTAATVAFGIAKGCRIVRVHDVKQMKRVAQMCDAMLAANHSP